MLYHLDLDPYFSDCRYFNDVRDATLATSLHRP